MLPACRSWLTSTCSPWLGARSASSPSAASSSRRSYGRLARRQLPGIRSAQPAASSASEVNGGPAGTPRRGSSSTATSSAASGGRPYSGVPGSQRSTSNARRPGSWASSRIAPRPSQCANAVASWRLSSSGYWSFSTARVPSGSVAGSASDANAYPNGGPTVSSHRATHAASRSGSSASHARPASVRSTQRRLSGMSHRIRSSWPSEATGRAPRRPRRARRRSDARWPSRPSPSGLTRRDGSTGRCSSARDHRRRRSRPLTQARLPPARRGGGIITLDQHQLAEMVVSRSR